MTTKRSVKHDYLAGYLLCLQSTIYFQIPNPIPNPETSIDIVRLELRVSVHAHQCYLLLLLFQYYTKYFGMKTPKGYTFDQAIQTGVDNPGHPHIYTVGCVAGDEESYTVFKDFFDDVITARHAGYDPKTQTHPTDLDFNKVLT